MSRVAWVRARIRRERPRIPDYTHEKLLARSADVRRCAEIAAFMGDDGPASEALYNYADELRARAFAVTVRREARA